MSVPNKRMFVNGKLLPSAHSALRGQTAEVPGTPRRRGHEAEAETPAKTLRLSTDQASVQPSLEELVKSRAFLAVSLPNCPQCDDLATFLAARGVPPTVFVKWTKSSPEYPALKAALAAFAGDRFMFPQVFANGAYQGGYADVVARADAGDYDDIFEQEFDVRPTTVRRWIQASAMVVFSLPNCPQCDVLYSKLEERGLPARDIFMKWDKADSRYQSLKAQLIELTGRGQFTFPQTFVRASYQGGFDEVLAKIEAGQLDGFFAEAFGVAPPRKPEPVAQPVMDFDDDF